MSDQTRTAMSNGPGESPPDQVDDKTIYNCHIHIFTRRHVPRHFLKLLFDDTPLSRFLGPRISEWLGVSLSELAQYKWFAWLLKHIAAWVTRITENNVLEREATLLDTGDKPTQAAVWQEIRPQYPTGSRFVVLPIDMTHANLGELAVSIDTQHAELLELAEQSKGTIIPFYFADPRRENLLADVHKNLVEGKFRGIKIYPNLGYRVDCEPLLDVYALCEERNVPVMTHCSTGGVWQYGLTQARRLALAHPDQYKCILTKFPNLRICLAHFGGGDEWLKHLEVRPDAQGTPLSGAYAGGNDTAGNDTAENDVGEDAEPVAWIKLIGDMIRSGKYPNLYTDISYTAFAPRFGTLYFDFFDYLKVLLANDRLRSRVLFGSDFYMVKREELSEKEVSIALRSRLGEEVYFQIANRNPKRYLGLD